MAAPRWANPETRYRTGPPVMWDGDIIGIPIVGVPTQPAPIVIGMNPKAGVRVGRPVKAGGVIPKAGGVVPKALRSVAAAPGLSSSVQGNLL